MGSLPKSKNNCSGGITSVLVLLTTTEEEESTLNSVTDGPNIDQFILDRQHFSQAG